MGNIMPKITASTFTSAGKFLTEMVDARNKEFVEDLANDLISNTPVCTGYARASWYVTPQIPKIINDVKPIDFKGTTKKCIGQIPKKTINLRKYKRNFSLWYIVNLAPYIKKLNEGSSKKAPPGFIDDIIFKHIASHYNMN
jgi:hypothetical protein